MKILVPHQVPYEKVRYHECIDHHTHDVWYFAGKTKLSEIPSHIRCHRVVVPDGEDMFGFIGRTVSIIERFDHVLALSEFGIREAVELREQLGLPGPSRTLIDRVRDKSKMKDRLHGQGIRVPKWIDGSVPDSSVRALRDGWDGPTILKPKCGASSEGVELFDSFGVALAALQCKADTSAWEIEEYITGQILHADGIVDGSKVLSLTVSKYIGTPLEFVGGRPLASVQVEVSDALSDYVQDVIAAVPIEVGAFHLEFFEHRGEYVFLEVANRLGGGGIVDVHRLSAGVNIPAFEIALRLGLPLPDKCEATGKYHGFIMASEGNQSTNGLPDCLLRPEIDQVVVNDPLAIPSDRVSYRTSELALYAELSHSDPTVLAAIADQVIKSIS
jgi:hypothetical protein